MYTLTGQITVAVARETLSRFYGYLKLVLVEASIRPKGGGLNRD
jgi:hypothetical protein